MLTWKCLNDVIRTHMMFNKFLLSIQQWSAGEKRGKEGRTEYLENEMSFLGKIKSTAHNFLSEFF